MIKWPCPHRNLVHNPSIHPPLTGLDQFQVIIISIFLDQTEWPGVIIIVDLYELSGWIDAMVKTPDCTTTVCRLALERSQIQVAQVGIVVEIFLRWGLHNANPSQMVVVVSSVLCFVCLSQFLSACLLFLCIAGCCCCYSLKSFTIFVSASSSKYLSESSQKIAIVYPFPGELKVSCDKSNPDTRLGD